MHRFYAPPESFKGRSVHLSLEETRHLRDVLRLREGGDIRIFNGAGREFVCKIEKIENRTTDLTIIEEVPPTASESNLDLTLAAAILKGEKFDLVVQKAVELGVSRLQPLLTKRCDVTASGSRKRTDRWRRIALEATKQSGRAKLTAIDHPVEFESFLNSFGVAAADHDRLILFTERNGSSFSEITKSKKMTAVIGPKGGWEDSELVAAVEHRFALVTFGGRILRAETAAISITSILQHRFGDLR